MTERLADVVIGLQRMMENARFRGEDLRYTQEQENYEHREWLNQQYAVVEKVRMGFLEELKKFTPPQRERPAQLPQDAQQMPRVVRQGPKEAAG